MFLTVCLLFGLLAAAEPTRGLPPDQPESDMLTVQINKLSSTESSRETLLSLINSERARAGVRLLQWDNKLAEAARGSKASLTCCNVSTSAQSVSMQPARMLCTMSAPRERMKHSPNRHGTWRTW